MAVGQFKIGVIIQARLGSTRLPNKVMLPLPVGSEKTIISEIIERVKDVSEISNVIVATSISKVNDDLESYIDSLKVECYRGSENDVLSRFYEIVIKHDFEYVIRLTGDNPIVDNILLKEFISNFISNDLDYSYSNNLPLGCNFEMMKASEIIKAYKNTEDLFDKEHVTPYIKRFAKKTEDFLLGWKMPYYLPRENEKYSVRGSMYEKMKKKFGNNIVEGAHLCHHILREGENEFASPLIFDEIAKRISKFKKNMKEPVFMKMSTDMNKRAVLDNPEVDASKFPGYDQANRIRGGLKIGGRVGLKDGSKGCGKAKAGKGKAYGKNS